MTTLATRSTTELTVPDVSASTRGYVQAAKSEQTRRAYQSDLTHFGAWCIDHGHHTLPATATAVADYISGMADDGYAPSTIGRRLAAISQAHQAAGYGEQNPTKSPGVRETHKGIRRTLQHRIRKATPLRSGDLRAYFRTTNGDLRSVQARAILTWGLAGAFRRSELVGLNVEDLEATDEGFRVTVWQSKTDQEGRGQVKAIVYGRDPATCPVLAMRAWLD